MKASPRVVRCLQTFNINIFVFALGMTISAYGATLLDLAEVFRGNVKEISYTLSTRAVGSIFGGIMGGLVFRFFNIQLVITACALLCGLATILTPRLSSSILFLHGLSFVQGCVLTLGEIGNHVWLQVIWKNKSGPQLQLYNFVFGVGGIIAPFICEPFLSTTMLDAHPSSDASHNATFSPLIDGAMTTSATGEDGVPISTLVPSAVTTELVTAVPAAVGLVSRIDIAYAIIGAVFIFNMLSLLFSYTLDSTDPKGSNDTATTKDELPDRSRYIVVALIAIYMLIGISDEIALAAYLPTFVIRNENLRFSKSEGAYLSSTFWMSFTVSRLVTTILTLKLTPAKLIIFSHTILMIATFGMLAFINTSRLVAWVGTIIVAFGIAPYFGNATIWGVQYIQLTHNYMSVLMVCVCLGAMVPGTVIGPFIDEWPMVMMVCHTLLSCMLTVTAIVLLLYGRTPLLREFHQRKIDREQAEKSTKDMLRN